MKNAIIGGIGIMIVFWAQYIIFMQLDFQIDEKNK
jgi:hypothetical protein